MTQDYIDTQLARDLSKAVYESNKGSVSDKSSAKKAIEKQLEKKGLTHIKIELVSSPSGDDFHGYFGALFSTEKDGKRVYYVAHKGTDFSTDSIRDTLESAKDIDDIFNIMNGKRLNEMGSAEKFHKQVMKHIPKGATLYGTGHSKGATIAQILGAMYHQDYRYTRVIDSIGDTPRIVRLYASEANIDALRNSKLAIDNTYPSALTSGDQLVKPRVLEFDLELEDKDIGNFGNLGKYAGGGFFLQYSYHIHDKDNLSNGKVKLKDWEGPWPSTRIEGWEVFNRDFAVIVDKNNLERDSLISKATGKVILTGNTGAKRNTDGTYTLRGAPFMTTIEISRFFDLDLKDVTQEPTDSTYSVNDVSRFVLKPQGIKFTAPSKPSLMQRVYDATLETMRMLGEQLDHTTTETFTPAEDNLDTPARSDFSQFYGQQQERVSPFQLMSKVYTAQDGDNVWDIARAHDVTVEQILRTRGNEAIKASYKINKNGQRSAHIEPGQIILIPPRQSFNIGHMSQCGENAARLSYGTVTGGGSQFFNPHFMFGNTKLTQSNFRPYGYAPIDSFIGGNYRGLNDFTSNLLNPFTQWKSLTVDVDNKLDTLKYFGFSTQYTSPKEADYTFKDTTPISSEQYAIKSDSVYYQEIQSHQYRQPYYFSQDSHIPGSGYWSQQYYANGYGSTWTSPNRDISIGIRWSHPIAIGLTEGITLIKLEESPIFFDVDDDSYAENIAWVSGEDGLLVYDYNNNKRVDSAKELILTKWDADAKSDLEALKNKFDTNKDNTFDKQDSEFNKFYVWQDSNQDGIAQDGEMTQDIESISFDSETPEQQLQDAGVLNVTKVKWTSGKITHAYDAVFAHSVAGVKFSDADGSVAIKYPEGAEHKVFRPDIHDQEVVLDLKDSLYRVVLGSSVSDRVTVASNEGVIVDGGDGDDDIATGDGSDWVKGGAGKDKIDTGNGHDIVFIDSEDISINGGAGFDVAFVSTSHGIQIDLGKTNIEAIYCNAGDDVVTATGSSPVQTHGGAGNDDISGSDDNDILVGGPGADMIQGGKGNDRIFIDKEDDLSKIDGGEGEDTICPMDDDGVTLDLGAVNAENFFGNIGDDKVTAPETQKSILHGGAGNDELTGKKGDVVLDGGPGNDILRGGEGNNKYIFSTQYGHDIIFSKGRGRGEAKDFVLLSSKIRLEDMRFTQTGNDLTLTLQEDGSSLTVSNWFIGNQHKVDGFILTSANGANKYIILYEEKEPLALKDGKDWIVFILGKANLQIEGSSGSEFLKANEGNDLVVGWGGNDVAYGNKGNDTLVVWERTEAVYPGGSCKFYGEEGNDILIGWEGDDVLDGGDGDDQLIGKGGNDRILTGRGIRDNVNGGDGDDVIIMQGMGDDEIIPEHENQYGGIKEVSGGKGNDMFVIDSPEEHKNTYYIIHDFEIGNPNEKIDFTKIAAGPNSVKSLDNFTYYSHTITIDPETRGDDRGVLTYKDAVKVVRDATWMFWDDGCVILAGVTQEQIFNAKPQFIFS